MTRTSIAPVALAAVGAAAALAAWGTFGDDGQNAGEYLAVLGVIGVAALVVYAWIVPRAAGSAVAGLVLSILGLVSVAVFWSGLPPVLAGGGVLIGWATRERAVGKAALVVGLLALAADVAVYIGDQV
jgi:hypothetical protein